MPGYRYVEISSKNELGRWKNGGKLRFLRSLVTVSLQKMLTYSVTYTGASGHALPSKSCKLPFLQQVNMLWPLLYIF